MLLLLLLQVSFLLLLSSSHRRRFPSRRDGNVFSFVSPGASLIFHSKNVSVCFSIQSKLKSWPECRHHRRLLTSTLFVHVENESETSRVQRSMSAVDETPDRIAIKLTEHAIVPYQRTSPRPCLIHFVCLVIRRRDSHKSNRALCFSLP